MDFSQERAFERSWWDPRGWDWNGIAHHSFNLMEDVCFSADMASIGMACTGIGIPEAGLTAAGSFLGKRIIQFGRHLIPKTVAAVKGLPGRSMRQAFDFFRGEIRATEFVWAKVQVNGKLVEGWVDIRSTVNRIKNGGSFPHVRDGSIFKNHGTPLPSAPKGYYKEYVIPTPGISHAGKQRLITGNKGEIYYSPDHYGTFIPMN